MKDNMKKLKQIAKSKGFKIQTGSDFKIAFFDATITTDKNAGPRVWEWSMLHELGHAELLVRKERCHVNTILRGCNMPKYKPTRAFYRDYLDMEWKAWEQGMKIAKREGIIVSEKGYWKHAKKCWQMYVDLFRPYFE